MPSGGSITIKPVEGRCHRVQHPEEPEIFSFVDSGVDVQQQAMTIKCRRVAEMLTERCMLDEMESDRILSGAKDLLRK